MICRLLNISEKRLNRDSNASPDLRIGLIGAGCSAGWHAAAIRALPGLQLAAVCDADQGMAAAFQVPAFGTVEQLIAAGLCDAVHILSPPPSREPLALQCLAAGLHCFVETPAALSAAGLGQMVQAADQAGKSLGVSHNFLALPGYARLKLLVSQGHLGRISALQVNWCLPLQSLRSGPFGLWLLREPRNLLLELGPHLFAFVVDLFGQMEVQHLALSQPVELPGMGKRHRGWRVLGKAGGVEVTLNLSLVETIDDRSVQVRGSAGMARFDYTADTLIVTRDNTAGLVLNPLRKELSLGWQHLREGAVNAARQALSLNQQSPYELGIRRAIGGFYDGIRRGTPDPRFSVTSARMVMQAIDDTLAFLPAPAAPPVADFAPSPKVMVIGGTGFVGRVLIRALVAKGHVVRVIGGSGLFEDLANHVEPVAVELTDLAALQAAMAGMDVVFHLAPAPETISDGALTNVVGMGLRVAGAVRLWGNGRNILPFVLVGDVADALIRMMDAPGIEGQSFNLIGEPLLSAREYLATIQTWLGARTRVKAGSLRGMWLADGAKYALNRHALQRTDIFRPSLADWKSRGHLARFRNDHAKTVLGWEPEPDKTAFLDRTISSPALFGF